MRASPEEYREIDLRAHSLLADVPLHDVWALDLPPTDPPRTMLELRAGLSPQELLRASAAVRFLFGLRARLGALLGWDDAPAGARRESYLERLTDEDRARSRVPPGTPDGPFTVLYVSSRESISEVHNATVHAFSVFALAERPAGPRLYWAVHVRPVGRITAAYMGLIDPFRRLIVYPAVLRHIRAAWTRGPRG